MKTRPRIVSLLGATALVLSTAAGAATPSPARTQAYIHKAWDTLTRSLEDCSALHDPKMDARPVLYLPAGIDKPAGIDEVARRCRVEVRTLPRRIGKLGDLMPSALPAEGLLYLPRPYVVPGGQFNEMYGWDSYFIQLGLLAGHRDDLARDMTDNMLFEVEHYGGVLNANRTYYLTRSQPPFLSRMVSDVLAAPGAFKDEAERHAWLARAYPLVVANYHIWTRPEHRAGDTGLARYFDLGAGPVPEMHGSAYYQGVIEWVLAHPKQDPGYLVKASEHPDAAEAVKLKTASCDIQASAVCAGAWARGYRLSADYYLGDRAMRESGFDTNFHFGPYGGTTHHYAGVGLNSLLYRYERDLHDLALQLGKVGEAQQWADAAARRKSAMDKYLWNGQRGMFMDYDFARGKSSEQPYVTTYWPLWAGLASRAQAEALDKHLAVFERKGGLSMDDLSSGAQWDEPFGWAPTHWLAISGLEIYGFHGDARRLARKFMRTVENGFAHDGTIREKYNMVKGNADVRITAGYTTNVIGFGWTNAVYLKLHQLLQGAPVRAPAAARSAEAPAGH
ncbi:trehalase family glycosidase [Frateuria soli]|uniref:trehalase family glycosidase n=1 Tax=Frateuria soli TaxID=1542730 RepID=UPI001E37341B|nr:trehalase family glycosidase [Frateuria soli]UGB37076.1 trehalase [Frateuria soli]